MAIKQLILILFVQNILADQNSVPVFIIDYSTVISEYKIETNPLKKITAEGFSNLIQGVINRSGMVLIFVEDNLCMEDVSMRDKLGTPFPHLRRSLIDKKVKFLPAVSEPYTLLNQIFAPHSQNMLYIGSQDPKKIMFDKRNKYYYIFFKDFVNGTRSETLRKHDDIMNKVYSAAREGSSVVVGFYTGKENPIVIKKTKFVSMEPHVPATVRSVTVASRKAMFRFIDVHAASIKRRSILSEKPTVTGEDWVPMQKLSTKMAYADFELQFNFSFTRTGWLLDNVAILEGGEEVGKTVMRVGAPWFCSYVCAEPMTIVNNRDGSQVVISQYQIQPMFNKASGLTRKGYGDVKGLHDKPISGPFEPPEGEPIDPPMTGPPPTKEATTESVTEEAITESVTGEAITESVTENTGGEKDNAFGEAVNCGPYFSVAIMTCLFVTAICLTILFCGVIMMFSCKSNDRFDDPSSKVNFGSKE